MVDAIQQKFSSKQLRTNQVAIKNIAIIEWAPLKKSNKTTTEIAECFLFCKKFK
jgi:hypothetical protein